MIKHILKKIVYIISALIIFAILQVLAFSNSIDSLHKIFNSLGLILFLDLLFIVHFFIFPFVFVIKYMDIVCLSILLFVIVSLFGGFLIKRHYRFTKYSIVGLVVSVIFLTGFSAYYEAVCFIQKVAEDKYHTKAEYISINLKVVKDRWLNPLHGFFDRQLYTDAHAIIKVGDQWYHWSFEKRDFVND